MRRSGYGSGGTLSGSSTSRSKPRSAARMPSALAAPVACDAGSACPGATGKRSVNRNTAAHEVEDELVRSLLVCRFARLVFALLIEGCGRV